MADCKEFQKMIVPFEAGELDIDSEERFVAHICQCDDCREEFEIHYIIEYGLGDPDDNLDMPEEYRTLINGFDFKGLVDLKLDNSVKKTERIRNHNAAMTFSYGMVNVIMLVTVVLWIIINYR